MPEAIDKPVRKIIHIDMDAFFASVEQRDNPQLRESLWRWAAPRSGCCGRGQLRGAQVRCAIGHALSHCGAALPRLVFVPPRFDVYRAVSQQIRQIFALHSDLVEPLSLDEAYLDVTRDKQRIGSATRIAQLIRAAIRDRTGLTASAGVSYNKFLAKVASDQNKPDGILCHSPAPGRGLCRFSAGASLYGVGPKPPNAWADLESRQGADLRDRDMDFLREHFGKSADYLYHAARGIDHRPVRPDRIRKSVGCERTYSEDLATEPALRDALARIIDTAWQRIQNNRACGRTVTLKVKYADFRQITRSRTSGECLCREGSTGCHGA